VPREKVGAVGESGRPARAKRMGGGTSGSKVGCGGMIMMTAAALVAWRCALATSRFAGLCSPVGLCALAPGRSVPRVCDSAV